jgi:CBS domain-containing protein
MKVAEQAWTVEDVMVEDVVTVTPSTPFKVLVEKLWSRGVSGLPVVDEAGRPVGIVSESDLLAKQEHGAGPEAMQWARHLSRVAADQGPDAAEAALMELSKAIGRTAADVMTSPVVTIGLDASLTEAATLMHRRGLKRLPVVDARGRLAGIVSRADLLKAFLRSDETIEADARAVLRAVLSDPEAVSVAVVDGIVTLTGDVASQPEAEAVVTRVEALPGVIGVQDHLRPVL